MYRWKASICFRIIAEEIAIQFLLVGMQIKFVSSVTYTGDVDALKSVKASVDGTTIPATSCLGSWDFTLDPCDFSSSKVFVCGLQCDNGTNGTDRRVTSLTLSATGYRGVISPSIGSLTALTSLDLSGNDFHGSIPESIAFLTMLEKLDLSQNSLSGVIPESLGQLTNLKQLSLSNNQLEGPFPVSLDSLIRLQALNLDNNLLTGPLPPLGSLSNLSVLRASANKLSGLLPRELPSSLNQLLVGNNLLSGNLPPTLITLVQLEVLDLRFNNISGGLDANLLTLPSLQQVNISSNMLSSLTAPTTTSSENSQLSALDLSFNKIQGSLPVWLSNMNQLIALSLRDNLFSGPIPMEYALKAASTPGSGRLPFVRLYLDANFLSGDIPYPFLNASSLGLTASFVTNCLRSCPANLTFCQGGSQRSESQCSGNIGSLP
eukprot:c22025_g1_i1 orf=588-1886(+)